MASTMTSYNILVIELHDFKFFKINLEIECLWNILTYLYIKMKITI